MITVIDYGGGNIGSVLNMIRKAGGQAVTTNAPRDVAEASKLLLPGVGSFDNAVTRLSKLGLMEPIRERANAGIPFLGICLGMQLLADASEEGHSQGLGLVPGNVRKFRFDSTRSDLKIPHMGWNAVAPRKAHALCDGLDHGARFYFVHSYHFVCSEPEDVLLETTHGLSFASGVQRKNVMGVQFHPEKSHRFGLQLLLNFIRL